MLFFFLRRWYRAFSFPLTDKKLSFPLRGKVGMGVVFDTYFLVNFFADT
jgi:hypothetical protein